MKINLNDTVEFTLTELGAVTYNRYYTDLGMRWLAGRAAGDVVSMSIWRMAGIFGRSLYNGCKMPFETTYMELENLCE